MTKEEKIAMAFATPEQRYLWDVIAEKSKHIDQLQSELTRLKEENTMLVDKLNEI